MTWAQYMTKGTFKPVLIAASLLALPSLAVAQQFTTAAEVRPILEATQANWVAVREYEGQDLLYFTHLLAWRCGLEGVRYAVNGGAMQRFTLEPCYLDENPPNAIKSAEILPFVTLELQSVDRVEVEVTYDDGQVVTAQFNRAAIQIN